jgi:hypothetical protein
MNEQKNLFTEAGNVAQWIINLAFHATQPLNLVSRRPGTRGASAWLPGIVLGTVTMMLITEIINGHSTPLPWFYLWCGQYVWLVHIVAYLRNHRQGNPVHKHDIGLPWFGTQVQCDSACAAALFGISVLFGDYGFALWWAMNVPLSIFQIEYLNIRDAARRRMVQSMQIENEYWADMFMKGDSDE